MAQLEQLVGFSRAFEEYPELAENSRWGRRFSLAFEEYPVRNVRNG